LQLKIAEKIAFILIERAWIPAPSTLLRMKAVIRELEIRELERKKEKGKGIFRLIGEWLIRLSDDQEIRVEDIRTAGYQDYSEWT
jgi:hypothetical protein